MSEPTTSISINTISPTGTNPKRSNFFCLKTRHSLSTGIVGDLPSVAPVIQGTESVLKEYSAASLRMKRTWMGFVRTGSVLLFFQETA